MFKSAAEVLTYIKDENIALIDVRFTDLPGVQQHFNVPAISFGESIFTDGLMFDGSSIRGFQAFLNSLDHPTRRGTFLVREVVFCDLVIKDMVNLPIISMRK